MRCGKRFAIITIFRSYECNLRFRHEHVFVVVAVSLYNLHNLHLFTYYTHIVSYFCVCRVSTYNEQSPRRSLNRIPIKIISKHREILFFCIKFTFSLRYARARTHARLHTVTNKSVVGARIRLFSYEIKLLLALCRYYR